MKNGVKTFVLRLFFFERFCVMMSFFFWGFRRHCGRLCPQGNVWIHPAAQTAPPPTTSCCCFCCCHQPNIRKKQRNMYVEGRSSSYYARMDVIMLLVGALLNTGLCLFTVFSSCFIFYLFFFLSWASRAVIRTRSAHGICCVATQPRSFFFLFSFSF